MSRLLPYLPLILFGSLGPFLLVLAGLFHWWYGRAADEYLTWPLRDAVTVSCADMRNPQTGYMGTRSVSEWVSEDGVTHEFYGYSEHCAVGTRFQTRVNPANPTEVAFEEQDRGYLGTGILAFMGFAFLGITIKALLQARKAAPVGGA